MRREIIRHFRGENVIDQTEFSADFIATLVHRYSTETDQRVQRMCYKYEMRIRFYPQAALYKWMTRCFV